MTPQEFFKNDLFAENAGVILLEVREGYSKAKLEINPNILMPAHELKEELSLHWQILHLQQPPILMVRCPFPSHPQSLFYVQAVRAIPFMPKRANAISVEVPVAIR